HCRMPQQVERMSHKAQPSAFSVLISHHAVAFFLLTLFHGGHSQAVGQPQRIVAMVGDDVTLPCHLTPPADVFNQMLEWSRADLKPRFVHMRRTGEDYLLDQNPSYMGRTSVAIEGLNKGDVSLKLSKVELSDKGTYRCFIPRLKKQSDVQLVVG
ncbi:butyrophilin subfamily 1 member A1-like, partial [Scomber scombrus]